MEVRQQGCNPNDAKHAMLLAVMYIMSLVMNWGCCCWIHCDMELSFVYTDMRGNYATLSFSIHIYIRNTTIVCHQTCLRASSEDAVSYLSIIDWHIGVGLHMKLMTVLFPINAQGSSGYTNKDDEIRLLGNYASCYRPGERVWHVTQLTRLPILWVGFKSL